MSLAGSDPPSVVCFLCGTRLRRPAPQIPNSMFGTRVIGQELGRSAATLQGLHALPEIDGLLRLVTGKRHQKQTDMIGLRLLRPIVGQTPQDVRARLLLSHTFAGMMGQ